MRWFTVILLAFLVTLGLGQGLTRGTLPGAGDPYYANAGYSVERFGAKGDGTSNDTMAINAAISSGKNIVFRQGATYLYNGTMTTVNAGQIIDGNGCTIKLGKQARTTTTATIATTATSSQNNTVTISVSSTTGFAVGDSVDVVTPGYVFGPRIWFGGLGYSGTCTWTATSTDGTATAGGGLTLDSNGSIVGSTQTTNNSGFYKAGTKVTISGTHDPRYPEAVLSYFMGLSNGGGDYTDQNQHVIIAIGASTITVTGNFTINYPSVVPTGSILHHTGFLMYSPFARADATFRNAIIDGGTGMGATAYANSYSGAVTKVTTPNGVLGGSITGITKASTAVVTTASAHGLADGDAIRIYGVTYAPSLFSSGGMRVTKSVLFAKVTGYSTTTFGCFLDAGLTVPYSTSNLNSWVSGGVVIYAGSPGSGWQNGATVNISGSGGSGATATAQTAVGITRIRLLNGGQGYGATTTTVTIANASGTQATCVPEIVDGVITGVYITNPGSGYYLNNNPVVTISDSGSTPGNGALAYADPSTVITGYTVTAGGSGYSAGAQCSVISNWRQIDHWSTGCAVYLGGDRSRAENIRVINWPGDAFSISGDHPVVSDCSVDHCHGQAYIFGIANNPQLLNCNGYDTLEDAQNQHSNGTVTWSDYITSGQISDCYFDGSQGPSIGGVDSPCNRLISIHDSTFRNSLGWAMDMTSSHTPDTTEHVKIHDNVFWNCRPFRMVYYDSNNTYKRDPGIRTVSISNNHFFRTRLYGQDLQLCSITGNYFEYDPLWEDQLSSSYGVVTFFDGLYNDFRNNKIQGGYYGLDMESGIATTYPSGYWKIDGNDFLGSFKASAFHNAGGSGQTHSADVFSSNRFMTTSSIPGSTRGIVAQGAPILVTGNEFSMWGTAGVYTYNGNSGGNKVHVIGNRFFQSPVNISGNFSSGVTYAVNYGSGTSGGICRDNYIEASSGISSSTTIGLLDSGSNLGINLLTITGITSATPAVVTTSAAHGLWDGYPVNIGGVGGVVEGLTLYAKVTGYSTTTFALYYDPFLTTAVATSSTASSGYVQTGQNYLIKN